MEICLGCIHANKETNVYFYTFVFCQPILKRSVTTPNGLFEQSFGPMSKPIGKMKFLLQSKSLLPVCTVKIKADFTLIDLEDLPEYISSEYTTYRLNKIFRLQAMQPSKDVLNIGFFNGPKKLVLSRSSKLSEWLDVTPAKCRWSVEQMYFFLKAHEDVFKVFLLLPANGRTWYMRRYDLIDASNLLSLLEQNNKIAALCAMLNNAKDIVQFDSDSFFASSSESRDNNAEIWSKVQMYANLRRISGRRIFENIEELVRPLCALEYSPIKIIENCVVFKEDVETVQNMVQFANDASKIFVGDIDFYEYLSDWTFVAPINLHSTAAAALGILDCKTPEDNCCGNVILLYVDLWGERKFLNYLSRSSCIFETIIWHISGHRTLGFRPSQNISNNLLRVTSESIDSNVPKINSAPGKLNEHLLYGKDGLKLGKLWVYVTQSYDSQQRLLKEYEPDNDLFWRVGDWVRADNRVGRIESLGGSSAIQKDSNSEIKVNGCIHKAYMLTQGKILRLRDVVQTLPRVCYFGDISQAFHEHRSIFRHTREAVVHHSDSFAFSCAYKAYDAQKSVAELVLS